MELAITRLKAALAQRLTRIGILPCEPSALQEECFYDVSGDKFAGKKNGRMQGSYVDCAETSLNHILVTLYFLGILL